MESLSDEKLCDRIGAGDRRAVAILYQRHVGEVLDHLRLLGGPADWVEDGTHDVFLKVWTALERGQRPQRFRVWIRRIAHNVLVDYWRHPHQGRELLVEVPETRALTKDIETPLVIEEALGQLDFALREILVLHFYQQFTLQEIAELLGAPLGTVKSRLARAYRHIAVIIRDGPRTPKSRKVKLERQRISWKGVKTYEQRRMGP